MYTRRGVVAMLFLLQSQGGTGEFMYKALILGNKLLLFSLAWLDRYYVTGRYRFQYKRPGAFTESDNDL